MTRTSKSDRTEQNEQCSNNAPDREPDEFVFVPETVEACWRGSFGGYTDAERTETLEDLAAAVEFCFNPRDDDVALIAILTNTLLGAASFIASLPCTCTPGDYDAPCDRCSALGRWHNEPVER